MNAAINNNDSFFGEVGAALSVEYCKVRHSRMLWITVLAFLLLALIGCFFMYIMKDPEQARRLGLVGAKAQIFGGTADWSSYFNLAMLLVSIGGMVVFGIVFVWIFGREFIEKTVYDILSLPTSRITIVISKLITAAYWSMILVLLVYVMVLVTGAALSLPGWSALLARDALERLLVTGLLLVVLSVPFALIASTTRGYLPAVGCIFLVLILSQVISQIGYGLYFPWTAAMLYSGAAETLTGSVSVPLGIISYVIIILVSFVSLAILCAWWRYADQK